MYSDFAPKLANVITSYSVPIQKGDFVVIIGTTEALPLITALSEAVLARGGYPHTQINIPHWHEYFLLNSDEDQLKFTNPAMLALYEKADVLFTIDAPHHVSHLNSVPADKLRLYTEGSYPINKTFFERFGSGQMRWCLSAWPTPARAQEANQGYVTYIEFLYKAYALHTENPAAYWEALAERQKKYTDWLMGKNHFVVKGPGIDLTFENTGRTWHAANGNANFPDGEILTCPIEESVNGYVHFNNPAYHAGRRVDGVKLKFVDGVVVEASADKSEDYLLRQLDIDAGARRIGEFAIGTNEFIQHVTGSTLLDEKIGGTLHMALGASANPSEGKNSSKIHWDIVHDMRHGGEMYADGELFYRDGKFLMG